MSFKIYAKSVMDEIKKTLGTNLKITNELNDSDEITTYVAISENDLWNGTTTYATIGLLTVNTGYFYEGKPLVSELIGVVDTGYSEYANVLGSVVTNTKSFGLTSMEGSIHKNVIFEYYPTLDVKHVVLTQSMFWDSLYTHDLGDKIVTWLTPIPLTDSELTYVQEKGLTALLDVFEENEVTISDLNRKSAV